MAQANASRPDDTTLVMTREFSAPRALVFEVWTTAEHLQKWFAPDGFELDCDCDFRVGGVLRLRMIGYGMDATARGKYVDIKTPERIVLAMTFDDVPDVEMKQTITFEELGPKRTRIVMRQELAPWDRIPADKHQVMRMRWNGASIGWTQTLEHLDAYCSGRYSTPSEGKTGSPVV